MSKVTIQSEETKVAEQVFSHECQNYLGYLNQRSKEEAIPEECMVCERLIDCMVKLAN